jgi:hypothetical protein
VSSCRCSRSGCCWCRRWRECSCWIRSGRWRRSWAGWREIDIALSASCRASGAVAEVLSKERVVSLHSGCSGCVTVAHCAVDHVKATLSLVQPQLEVGSATPREILRTPFNVEDAIGSGATDRCKYSKPAVDQIQVVPIRVDRVIVAGPRQADVSKGRIRGRKLRVAVGRQINAGKALVV